LKEEVGPRKRRLFFTGAEILADGEVITDPAQGIYYCSRQGEVVFDML
jgi:hypothetical protein